MDTFSNSGHSGIQIPIVHKTEIKMVTITDFQSII